jgi:hypothetical protein
LNHEEEEELVKNNYKKRYSHVIEKTKNPINKAVHEVF